MMEMDLLAVPFAIILGVSAVAVAVYAGVLHLQMMAAKKWKPARGEIVESRVDSRVVTLRRPKGQSVFDNSRPTRTDYRAIVKYRYEVAGRTLSAERVMLSPSRWSPFEPYSANVVARYPAGANVRVLYDPKEPTRAVLERVHERGAFGWLVTAGVLVVLAVLMLVFGR